MINFSQLEINDADNGFIIYRLWDFNMYQKKVTRTPMITELHKGVKINLHSHNVETDFYFIYWKGIIYIWNKTYKYKKWDHFYVQKDELHWFVALEDSLFLSSIDLPISTQRPNLIKDLNQ